MAVTILAMHFLSNIYIT